MLIGHCPHCGWPDKDPYESLSRHTTPQGETVWTRCVCGSVQVRECDASGCRITVRGRPPEGKPVLGC